MGLKQKLKQSVIVVRISVNKLKFAQDMKENVYTVTNPLIVYYKIRRNPYPLVLTCLKKSGITAFFTRSSAANIPVNMTLCEELGLDKDTYSVSIPLGATVNIS